MRAKCIILALATVLAIACSERDESTGLESWTISETPTISIGLVEGDSVYMFQRIADARFTSGGGILVADEGLSVIREYGPDGAFIAQIGGRGRGPGEFQSLRGIWTVDPDTIGAWDSRALRLTYFGGDRTVARTVSLESANAAISGGRFDFFAGHLPDRSMAIATVALAAGSGPDRVTLERIGPSGEHLARLAETTGLVRARLADRVIGPVPFSPYPYAATYGDVVYHTNGARPVVTAWSSAGERHFTFPPHDYDVGVEWAKIAAEVQNRNVEPFVRAVVTAPRPESIPHLAGLLVDDARRVWAKRYDPLTDAIWLRGAERGGGGTWWVADSLGTLVAAVQAPKFFRPLRVSDTRVLGIVADSLGVERIEVRTLSR